MSEKVGTCKHGTSYGHGNSCIFCLEELAEAAQVGTMKQWAPFPDLLADLVERLRYRPGWTFSLKDKQRDDDHGRGTAGGLTFVIETLGYNSYHVDQGEHYSVYHYFIVPAATYDERSWRRWIFDSILKVETHETCEFFSLERWTSNEAGDEYLAIERPFAPIHAPGADPYTVVEYATDEERRTSFRGVLKSE